MADTRRLRLAHAACLPVRPDRGLYRSVRGTVGCRLAAAALVGALRDQRLTIDFAEAAVTPAARNRGAAPGAPTRPRSHRDCSRPARRGGPAPPRRTARRPPECGTACPAASAATPHGDGHAARARRRARRSTSRSCAGIGEPAKIVGAFGWRMMDHDDAEQLLALELCQELAEARKLVAVQCAPSRRVAASAVMSKGRSAPAARAAARRESSRHRRRA